MKQLEKEELQEKLKKNGIYLTDFISSSTYDAVVNLLYRTKRLPTVSERFIAAYEYKNGDPIRLYKSHMDSDFIAGVHWLIRWLNESEEQKAVEGRL